MALLFSVQESLASLVSNLEVFGTVRLYKIFKKAAVQPSLKYSFAFFCECNVDLGRSRLVFVSYRITVISLLSQELTDCFIKGGYQG